jgi:hypothetical protein
MEKFEGKRPLVRPRRRWEDSIKKILEEGGWGAWTGLMCIRIEAGIGILSRW